MSWNRSKVEKGKSNVGGGRKTMTPHFFPLVCLSVISITILALLCVLAWCRFHDSKGSGPDGETRRERKTLIAEAMSQKTTNHVEAVRPSAKQLPTARAARGAGSATILTLPDGTVVTNVSRTIFKRDLERGLMVAFRPGGMSGGIIRHLRMRHSDEEILAMVMEKVQISPDDPDNVKRIKESVQSVKDAIMDEIRQGTSLRTILNSIQNHNAYANKIRVNAQKLRAEAIKMQDPELVDFVVQSENEKLRELGLPQMANPTASIENSAHDLDEHDPGKGLNISDNN